MARGIHHFSLLVYHCTVVFSDSSKECLGCQESLVWVFVKFRLYLLSWPGRSLTNLTKIRGAGPKRALELELAGVKSVSDLAKRSPKKLAEKTGIPITQISKWINEANKHTK